MENNNCTEYLSNFSYLFVPFTSENLDDFPVFCRNLSKDPAWEAIGTENRYLHRYVSDKIVHRENECGYQFRLRKNFAEERMLLLNTPYWSNNERFSFQIAGVELFTFSTAIGVLVFDLRFPTNDPKTIASAQYHLRKLSTNPVCPECLDQTTCSESFVDISRRLLENANGIALDFFFYAAPENEKANFLTYIDMTDEPKRDSYDKDLFYLKWCYNDSFIYDEAYQGDDSENYAASQHTVWGLSSSAAVCLVTRDEIIEPFIKNTFQKNFRAQYLLTYTLLLHQKYMMYLFLTKMSVGLDGNLEQLEKYKALLYKFETYYMFSYVSEVPQYQRFYSKVRRLFALEELFRDVQEPLMQLTEIQRQKAEAAQQKRESQTASSLTLLSFLAIVSALADASGVTSVLTDYISPCAAKIAQLVALAIVIGLSVYTIIRLVFSKKR